MANAKAKDVRLGRQPLSKDDIPQVFYRHYPAHKNDMLNISEFARVCNTIPNDDFINNGLHPNVFKK
jgi:hypothetical protein